jgi:NAD+ kinase
MGNPATVALLVHQDRAEAYQLAAETVTWLEGKGHRSRLLLADGSGQIREDGSLVDLALLDLGDTKLAVSLGGDGTFLRLIPPSWRAGVPVLGVNFGRLGYLLELRPEQLLDALAKALSGEISFEERAILESFE